MLNFFNLKKVLNQHFSFAIFFFPPLGYKLKSNVIHTNDFCS
jgi:hypothetical protein